MDRDLFFKANSGVHLRQLWPSSGFKDFQLDSAAGVFRALCLIHRIAIFARCAGDLMHASMQGGHPVATAAVGS